MTSDQIETHGPNSVWRNMRRVINGKSPGQRNSPSVNPDVMNDFFVNVGPRVSAEVAGLGGTPDLPVRLPRVGACAFKIGPVSLDYLRKTIFSMRNSSACGPDGICIRILKMCFDQTCNRFNHD